MLIRKHFLFKQFVIESGRLSFRNCLCPVHGCQQFWVTNYLYFVSTGLENYFVDVAFDIRNHKALTDFTVNFVSKLSMI